MDVSYVARTHEGLVQVVGYQIGRFAVRRLPDGSKFQDKRGNLHDARDWAIDHINTGIVIMALDSFDKAVLVADDLSRFSASDVDTCDVQGLSSQIGQSMISWLSWINVNNKPTDYRTWKKEEPTCS